MTTYPIWFNDSEIIIAQKETAYKRVLTEFSKDFHNNFTPFELCCEIVDKLDQQNLVEGKWLVIANIEFVYVVIKYFQYKQWNINNIYFVTPCSDYKKKVVVKMGILEDNIRIYNYETLNVCGGFKDMKFDVIVGNPPYQKGGTKDAKNPKYLWPEFIQLAFHTCNKNGYISLITPKGWTTNQKQYQIFLDNNVLFIDIDFCKKYFPGVNSTFSYFIINKTDPSGNPITIRTLTNLINVNELPQYGLGVVDINAFSILDKIKKFPKFKMITSSGYNSSKFSTGCNTVSKTQTSDHKYKILHAINNTGREYYYSSHLDTTTYKVPRLICSVWLSRWADMFVSDVELTSQDFRHFPMASICEAECLKKLLNSKLYTFIATFLSSSNRLTNFAVENFPKIDLTNEWTDQELYKHFNLTQEEINLIERTII